ncbi:hypothetical protein [Marinobacterium sp. BA1]|uniref:hypothetical protein n=1 Tax=Marinobacterium sp. BA1 TaxID=3138931 RepID=UPI0032E7EB88
MAIRVRPEALYLVNEGIVTINTRRPLTDELKADIHDVLSFMRANELHLIAGAFERACIAGDVSNQYIDTRVSAETVAATSGTDVSRSLCTRLIERIQQHLSEADHAAEASGDPLATHDTSSSSLTQG